MIKRSMSDKNITVVVPCYNVENYLERCLESLLAQTHKDIEILMVDDCSTDGTKKIIQKYEKKYKNITAIYNKQNRRQGHARNIAIQAAKTEYITFVDSDDWVEPNFLHELYEALVKGDADVAVCDIYIRYDDSAADFRVKMYDPKPNRFGLINAGFAASSSNKLFKTEILKKFKYPEDIINEDVPVVLAIMYKHDVVYTDKTYYNYYQRPGSTQNGQITNKRLDAFEALEVLKTNIGSKIDKKIWDSIVWHQIIQLLLGVLPRATGVLHRKRLVKEFYERAQKYDIDIIDNSHLNEFRRASRLNKIYIGGLVKFLDNKLFLPASMLMGCYIYYLKHMKAFKPFVRVLRLIMLLIKHPRTFFSRLKTRLLRKYVIKKNLTIKNLIRAAKKQRKLPADTPVSVVIPNYNYERYLIQRIYSILYQTEKIGEILILDDNSTDDSVKLAQKIEQAIGEYVPVRLINNTQNQGVFKQWEKGFIESKYEYVWIAEADDFCNSKFLKSTLEPLNANSNVVLSYTDTGFMDEGGLFLDSVKIHIDYQESGHWDKSYINNGLDEAKTYSFLNNTIANVSSVIFRKKSDIDYPELFSHLRGYKQAGDWVFYVNYMLHGDIAYVDKVFNYYRLHGSNVSSTTKANDHLNEILKIYAMLHEKLQLTKSHKEAQKKRIKFLKKAWNI